MNERIYLDWNATAPLRKEARAAALAALGLVGNPSSVHAEGRTARHVIEQAREQVAALVGAAPRNVVFTSGGTEANMSALVPTAARDRLLVSAIEHPSVLAGGRFPTERVERLPVTGRGEGDLDALEARAGDAGRRAVGWVMVGNDGVGVDVAAAVRSAACAAARRMSRQSRGLGPRQRRPALSLRASARA